MKQQILDLYRSRESEATNIRFQDHSLFKLPNKRQGKTGRRE